VLLIYSEIQLGLVNDVKPVANVTGASIRVRIKIRSRENIVIYTLV